MPSPKTFKQQSRKYMKNDTKAMPKHNQKSLIFQFCCVRVTLGSCWFYVSKKGMLRIVCPKINEQSEKGYPNIL